MNRVYITGIVTKKSRLMFEKVKGLEGVIKLEIQNTLNEDIQRFNCIIKDKLCEYALKRINIQDNVYLEGNAKNTDKGIVICATKIIKFI